MRRVYKYRLNFGETALDLPYTLIPLSVGTQGDDIFLWGLADESLTGFTLKLFVAGTGREIPDGPHDFLGTVFTGENNRWVWHVFRSLD